MSNNPSSSDSANSHRGLALEDAGEGVLTRWSRRKAEARSGKPASDEAFQAPLETIGTAAREVEQAPATPACEAVPDLPDIEKLDLTSDFTAFLRDGVDPLLRRAALRRLWTLDPVFAWQDGLVEYGEDFTDSVKAVPVVQTVFRGWDMLSELTNSIASDTTAESSSQAAAAPVGKPCGTMGLPQNESCDRDAHAGESSAQANSDRPA